MLMMIAFHVFNQYSNNFDYRCHNWLRLPYSNHENLRKRRNVVRKYFTITDSCETPFGRIILAWSNCFLWKCLAVMMMMSWSVDQRSLLVLIMADHCADQVGNKNWQRPDWCWPRDNATYQRRDSLSPVRCCQIQEKGGDYIHHPHHSPHQLFHVFLI